MQKYECAVILNPTLNDQQIQEQREVIKGWLTALGAEVSDIDIWGRRRLAFPIRKMMEGFYVIYYFTLDAGRQRLPELDKRVNASEAILRHMVVRLPALKETPRVPREEEPAEEAEAVEEPAKPAVPQPEQAPQQAPELAPEQAPEQAPDQAPEQAPEQAPQQVPELADETAPEVQA